MRDKHRIKKAIAVLVSALLASCSFNDVREEVLKQRSEMKKNICEFEVSTPSILISHISIRGGTVHGDINQLQDNRGIAWASVLATTEKPVANIVTKDQCVYGWTLNYYGMAVPVWGDCSSRESKSLADVYGLGRVPVDNSRNPERAMKEAVKLAKNNCKAQADSFAKSTPGISKYNSALKCVVLERQYCAF